MLEEAEFCLVLIFGKPANGLSNNRASFSSDPGIKATAGYVASGLRRSIANKLGLDNLEFDMGQNIGQEKVTVGKYVLKDVYVEASATARKTRTRGIRRVSNRPSVAGERVNHLRGERVASIYSGKSGTDVSLFRFS